MGDTSLELAVKKKNNFQIKKRGHLSIYGLNYFRNSSAWPQK